MRFKQNCLANYYNALFYDIIYIFCLCLFLKYMPIILNPLVVLIYQLYYRSLPTLCANRVVYFYVKFLIFFFALLQFNHKIMFITVVLDFTSFTNGQLAKHFFAKFSMCRHLYGSYVTNHKAIRCWLFAAYWKFCFKIYYQNVLLLTGLRSKTMQFYHNLCISSYDIVILTETWLLPRVSDSELFDNRYIVWRRDRDYVATVKLEMVECS